LKVGLIGLMQSGKSTLLAAISGRELPHVPSVNIEESIVPVPDERVDWLSTIYNPKKKVYATVDCLDVPGFSFMDESGRAAARRLVNQIRTIDMLVLVIRGFENDSVPMYRESVNPQRDYDELMTELLLADLEQVTTRIERLEKEVKKPSKKGTDSKAELELMLKLQDAIENEKPISSAIGSDAELELIRSFGFLTLKPMAVVINTGEDSINEPACLDAQLETIGLCAELEYELSQLDDESKAEFMNDLGISQPACVKFVQSCYTVLGLISFLTVGSDECRAWTITKGTTALDAAGKIHSDIKRGFIRAETTSYADMKELGSEKEVKAAGKARLEGKTYIVEDGDIINFRFNV
jgi:ribosome-binding ATPase